jgi:hypothetical protein
VAGGAGSVLAVTFDGRNNDGRVELVADPLPDRTGRLLRQTSTGTISTSSRARPSSTTLHLTTHRGDVEDDFMYQPCTSTTVYSGQQRGATVTPKPNLISPNGTSPGTHEILGPGLITRRSQVQILPPPPSERPGQTAWAFDVVEHASPASSTGSIERCGDLDSVAGRRLPAAALTSSAKRSAAVALMPGRTC